MPVVTGTLEDIGAVSMASLNARVILSPDEVSTKGSVIMPTKEIVAVVGSGGAFSFANVRASLENNPFTPYKLAIEWQDTAGNYTRTDFPNFQIVVPPAGGTLASMVSLVSPSKIVTKGDGATMEDIEAAVSALLPGILATAPEIIAAGEQAVTDALAAADIVTGDQYRAPKQGAKDQLRVLDLNNKAALEVTPTGDVNTAGATLRASDGFRFMDLAGYVALEVTPAGRTLIYDCNLGSGGTSSTVDALHVFLAVGQSNMSGRGLPIGGEVTNPRILQYGAKSTPPYTRALGVATVPLNMHDTSTGLSPATTFAENYLKTQPSNVAVLIIPAAHGGTGFTSAASTLTWTVGAASAPEFDLPALAIAQALEGIEAARAAGYTVTTKCVLWHQGEDNSGTSQGTYEGLLDGLISYLRTSLGGATLPFVVGQMSPEGIAATTGRPNIDKAHSGTPARVAYTGFAPSMAGATNDGDTTHFSKIGIDYLGKTYLAGFWQALGNATSAAPQPPSNVTATKTDTTVTVQWSGAPASLAKAETFDLTTGSLAYNWSAPQSHTTGYRVETKTGAGAWTTATRAWGMAITEAVTVAAGTTQVRVTALNGAAESVPVTVTAVGA